MNRREVQAIVKQAEAKGLGNDPRIVAARQHLAETKDAPVTRKARSTGTQVTVCTAEDAGAGFDGETEGLRWYTVCDTHGYCVGHETKKLALSWASSPEGWCEECQKLVKGRSA